MHFSGEKKKKYGDKGVRPWMGGVRQWFLAYASCSTKEADYIGRSRNEINSKKQKGWNESIQQAFAYEQKLITY